MDDQQQQRINRAAQEFTDALVAAYTTTADSNVVAQELGAQQIEYFFNTVISNLRTQAEGTSQLTQQLADQQRLARETTRQLTQLSTDNYLDLLDSVFSFYQGGTSRTQRRAEEAQRQTEEAKRSTEQAQRRVKEAQKSARAAQKRAEEAERGLEEAKGRTEQAEERAREAQRRAEEAERRAEEAQGRSQETERSLEEAQRRTVEAERRAQEAHRSRSEAPESQGESQGGGSEEGDTKADAVRHPLSTWVRTSGRSKVRGRNTRSQRRSSRRR